MRGTWLASFALAIGGTASAQVLISVPDDPTRNPACGLAPVPASTQLVALSVYTAETISSAYVGSPDQETFLTDVTIEPGPRSLHLVLSSYEAMVWRLHGAVHRVAGVTMWSAQRHAGASASGVIGVPKERVSDAPPGCTGYYSDEASPDQSSGRIAGWAGRAPDATLTTYTSRAVGLPSGRINHALDSGVPKPKGFDRDMWAEASRFWPGGVATVTPARIVSLAPTGAYEVLPSQAGLAQWIGKGAIVRTAAGLRITRSMPRMPPGMGGSHATRLIVADGVPVPPGDPVHSCVIVEGRPWPTNRRSTCDMPYRQ